MTTMLASTMKRSAVVLIALIWSQAAVAQAPSRMTNQDVIRLVKAGLSENIIVAKIRESRADAQFDTSVDALIALKQAGVSEAIVRAMLAEEAAGTTGATSAPGQATPGSDEPFSEAGVFLQQDGRFLRLEPIAVSPKAGFAKLILVLPGPSARLTAREAKPTFVFSFANAVGALAMSGPGEFVLIKVNQKKDSREIKLPPKQALAMKGVAFGFEEIGARRYRVTPSQPLVPGEYAFVHTELGRCFDFRVAAGPVRTGSSR